MNKKILLAALIAVNVIVYLTTFSRSGKPGKKTTRTPRIVNTAGPIPTGKARITPPPPDHLAVNPFQSYRKKETTAIPREKITPASTAVIEPDFVLKGILYDEKNPSAIVEDSFSGSSMILKTGASYRKSTITEINKSHIIISVEGKKFKLVQDHYEEIK